MSRLLMTGVVWLLLFGVPAYGEFTCREPVRPELPSDKADLREMSITEKVIKTYIRQMEEYRACLVRTVNDVNNELQLVVEGWNHALKLYEEQRTAGGKTGR